MHIKSFDKRATGFWVYWFPVFSYMALIFFLSSRSSFPLSPLDIPYFDKICHLVEFAILGYLLIRAFIHSDSPDLNKYALLLTIIVAVLFGLTDELHQLFVPMRHGDVYDLIFDGLGAVMGGCVALWINQYCLKKREEINGSQSNIF